VAILKLVGVSEIMVVGGDVGCGWGQRPALFEGRENWKPWWSVGIDEGLAIGGRRARGVGPLSASRKRRDVLSRRDCVRPRVWFGVGVGCLVIEKKKAWC